MRLLIISAACSLAVAASGAHAADAKIPASSFAKHFEYYNARLSPTGEYVSVLTPYKDRRALSIIRLSDGYSRVDIKFDNFQETVIGGYWTDDYRLLISKGINDGTLEAPKFTGALWASDADGSNQMQLFGYVKDHGTMRSKIKDEGWASYMRRLDGTKGEALFSFDPWPTGNSDTKYTIYRVDTHTGKRKQTEVIANGGGVTADRNGVVRYNAYQDLQGNNILKYRPTPDSDWQSVPASLAGHSMGVSYFEPDNNHAIAAISDKGEPAQIYRVDFVKGTRNLITGNDTMSVGRWELSGYDGGPFAVMYDGGKPKIDYIDPKSPFAQLHAGLMKIFPGQMVDFVSFTRDDKKVMFHVWGDRHPGAYYIFDRTTNTPQMLFEEAEWIDPAKMAPTLPLEFKNSHGDTLYGFYTAPLGKSGKLPMVVMPHGGPFGISDSWGYQPDVQFLANRGYAVLQVNYRGSGSRGDTFERSTYKQWGTGIQDDIADGVRYAIANGMADPGKVCIYGASFGGYSALMNPIRNPGMYKCAIGYAGVYDLPLSTRTDARSSKQTAAYFDRSMGTDEAELEKQSPSYQVAKLDIPVLLIHGKSDHTAPFEQFKSMEAALKKSGKTYETLVKPDEGHGFFDEKNQTEAYERMEAFLAKYNPVN